MACDIQIITKTFMPFMIKIVEIEMIITFKKSCIKRE